MTASFACQDIGTLSDGVLWLRLREKASLRFRADTVPAYRFDIVDVASGCIVGRIDLRLGDSPLLYYGGHIGYLVYPPHRGHGIALAASRLLLPLAQREGMHLLYITCNPDNLPSRRTIERLGATLIEIANVPETHPLYAQETERVKCIFRLAL